MNLPDDYDITTDDDDDDDCQMDHFSSLDQYINSYLKMNFTLKSKIHHSYCKKSIIHIVRNPYHQTLTFNI